VNSTSAGGHKKLNVHQNAVRSNEEHRNKNEINNAELLNNNNYPVDNIIN
jgi:hypothetical protein